MRHTSPIETAPIAGAGRRELYEVAAFLFLIVPSLVTSFLTLRQTSPDFPIVAPIIILRDLGLVGLILYFMWRNGEPLGRLGWTSRRFAGEAVLGVVLFIPLTLATVLADQALQNAGLSRAVRPLPAFLTPVGPGQMVLALLLVLVAAVTEETIFRGYLFLRLKSVTGSLAGAIVLSSVVFSLGHGYEGAGGALIVGLMGAVLALVYVWRGSLTAPIVMHFCQDFAGIVLLPSLH